MNKAAIITGDIINSRLIEPSDREELYKGLNSHMKSLREEGYIKKFEFYRGDSIQCEVKKSDQSLRVALMIKCFVKSYRTKLSKQKATFAIPKWKQFDIRLSIGIGRVDFTNASLSRSDGEAFLYSGEGLDELKNTKQQLYFKSQDALVNLNLELPIMLIDAIIQKYSFNQSEVIRYKLTGMKEEEIAEKIEISQSAVNQRASSAFWYAVDKTVNFFENYKF